jgi:hypothetical protein
VDIQSLLLRFLSRVLKNTPKPPRRGKPLWGFPLRGGSRYPFSIKEAPEGLPSPGMDLYLSRYIGTDSRQSPDAIGTLHSPFFRSLLEDPPVEPLA